MMSLPRGGGSLQSSPLPATRKGRLRPASPRGVRGASDCLMTPSPRSCSHQGRKNPADGGLGRSGMPEKRPAWSSAFGVVQARCCCWVGRKGLGHSRAAPRRAQSPDGRCWLGGWLWFPVVLFIDRCTTTARGSCCLKHPMLPERASLPDTARCACQRAPLLF